METLRDLPFSSIQLRFYSARRGKGESQLSLLASVLDGMLLISLLLGRGSGSVDGTSWSLLLGEAHSNVLSDVSLVLANSVLSSSGFSLGLKVLFTNDFSLGFVDLLNKNVLVLELVTLSSDVESVVHFAIDLLLVSISLE